MVRSRECIVVIRRKVSGMETSTFVKINDVLPRCLVMGKIVFVDDSVACMYQIK